MTAVKNMKIKEDRFKIVATKRVNNVLSGLQSLQKCANKNNYIYTSSQVKKMLSALQVELDTTKRVFTQDKSSSPDFHF